MAAAIKDTVNSMLSALNLGGEKAGEDAPPQPPTDSEFTELKEKYEKAGQGHVFQYWEELKPAEKGAIYKQLQPIDPEHINKITERPSTRLRRRARMAQPSWTSFLTPLPRRSLTARRAI
jgi:UDP-N-acetylglucosamine/UDP-N-acetylgalactosamine diphosphorylase